MGGANLLKFLENLQVETLQGILLTPRFRSQGIGDQRVIQRNDKKYKCRRVFSLKRSSRESWSDAIDDIFRSDREEKERLKNSETVKEALDIVLATFPVRDFHSFAVSGFQGMSSAAIVADAGLGVYTCTTLTGISAYVLVGLSSLGVLLGFGLVCWYVSQKMSRKQQKYREDLQYYYLLAAVSYELARRQAIDLIIRGGLDTKALEPLRNPNEVFQLSFKAKAKPWRNKLKAAGNATVITSPLLLTYFLGTSEVLKVLGIAIGVFALTNPIGGCLLGVLLVGLTFLVGYKLYKYKQSKDKMQYTIEYLKGIQADNTNLLVHKFRTTNDDGMSGSNVLQENVPDKAALAFLSPLSRKQYIRTSSVNRSDSGNVSPTPTPTLTRSGSFSM